MSDKTYLVQERSTKKVADTLISKGDKSSLQWVVICLFYAGIHYVNSYHCAHIKEPLPHTHSKRRNNASRYMEPVAPAYSWIKDHSEKARYEFNYSSQDTVKLAYCKVIEIQKFVSGNELLVQNP